jgi:hypothetical protein
LATSRTTSQSGARCLISFCVLRTMAIKDERGMLTMN